MSGLARGAALAAGAAGLGLLGKGLVDSVKAAETAQQAQTRLQAALAASGISFAEHGATIESAIRKTSQLAAIDDEDLSSAFAKLVRTTGNVKESLTAMNVAADIARARNISLEAATQKVQMALLGQTRGLKSVGVEVFKNMSAHEALAAAQKKFAGAAEAYGKTAAGAQDRLGVSVENLKESFGAGLLPAIAKVVGVAASFAQVLAEHKTLATALVAGLALLSAGLVALSVAQKIAAVASAVFTAAQWALNVAMDANPIGLVVIAIAALVAGFVVAYKTSGTFRAIVQDALGGVEKAASSVKAFFESQWPRISAAMQSVAVAAQTAIAAMRTAIETALAAILAVWGVFGGTITSIAATAFATVRGIVSGALTAIQGVVDVVMGVITGDWGRAWNGLKTIVSGVLDGIWALIRGQASIAFTVATALGSAILSGVQAGVSGLVSWVSGRVDAAIGAVTGLAGAAARAGEAIGSSILSAAKKALGALAGDLASIVRGAINAAIDIVNRGIGLINSALDFTIPGVGVTIGGKHIGTPDIHVNSPNIPSVPHLARGGIITAPTIALLGESGPEAVVPLGRGAGGITVNVYTGHVYGPGGVSELARQLRTELQRVGSRNA